MVRLPLMLREVLESDADVPDNENELGQPQSEHANRNKRTRGDGVVGVRALSADADRST